MRKQASSENQVLCTERTFRTPHQLDRLASVIRTFHVFAGKCSIYSRAGFAIHRVREILALCARHMGWSKDHVCFSHTSKNVKLQCSGVKLGWRYSSKPTCKQELRSWCETRETDVYPRVGQRKGWQIGNTGCPSQNRNRIWTVRWVRTSRHPNCLLKQRKSPNKREAITDLAVSMWNFWTNKNKLRAFRSRMGWTRLFPRSNRNIEKVFFFSTGVMITLDNSCWMAVRRAAHICVKKAKFESGEEAKSKAANCSLGNDTLEVEWWHSIPWKRAWNEP